MGLLRSDETGPPAGLPTSGSPLPPGVVPDDPAASGTIIEEELSEADAAEGAGKADGALGAGVGAA